jgi:hypothetical protein
MSSSEVLVDHDHVRAQLLDDANSIEEGPRFGRYLEAVLFEHEPHEVPLKRSPIGDDDA